MINFLKMREKISKREVKVAVWGCGFVGVTNVLHLVKAGYSVLGIDVDPQRVNDVKMARFNVKSDYDYIGHLSESEKERMDVISNYEERDMNDYKIHMLSLPTEKNFGPSDEFVRCVVNNIAKSGAKDFLLIIECSMPPRWIDESILSVLREYGYEQKKDFVLGAAPRRDEFGDRSFRLSETDRVIGSDSKETEMIMWEFYSSFCKKLVVAKDVHHAVLSKIVENTYRCFDISLANQLSEALTGFDMTHVLELASTKWNVEKYHPSFGVGGHCVPIAPQYIMKELELYNKEIPIFNDFLDFNNNSVGRIYNIYKELVVKGEKIAILGVSSIPNVGIGSCSIAIRLAKEIMKEHKDIYLHDEYINNDKLKSLSGCEVLEGLERINEFGTIFVLTQHEYYKESLHKLNFKKGAVVIDCFGVWPELKKRDELSYVEVGRNDEICLKK